MTEIPSEGREAAFPPVSEAHTRACTGVRVGGRHRLRRPRAAGAMGVVWEAEDLETGEAVAVKLMTGVAAAKPDGRARFEREARALARARHPHVVEVLDAGQLPDGAPYLVMELLDGETLAEVLARRGRADLTEVCEWLRPVAAALDAVHAAGVVHRDVKPANVVLAEGPGGPRAKLVDFGLALFDEPSEDPDAAIRPAGHDALVGTPAYLAPETAMGSGWTAASDVYALACVAYELLTGEVPHARDSAIGMLTARFIDPPPAPSTVLGPRTPSGLDAVFARALSRDPAERPPSAGAFVRALVRVAEGRADAAQDSLPPPTETRAPKRTRPRRRRSTGLWIALAATLGAALTGALLFGGDGSELADARDTAEREIPIVAGPRVR